LLKCTEVSKRFGGLQALKKVDFRVNKNEIAGLVGPNGSGKSTLLNLISGVYKPDSGKILFMNEDISKFSSYKICSRGITKTSQTVQSFPDMTAIENVLTGVLFVRNQGIMLKPEQLRVLKVMNEVTFQMDLNEFARTVNLTVNEMTKQIQKLVKTGHLRNQGTGYVITEKGKAELKAQTPIHDGSPKDMAKELLEFVDLRSDKFNVPAKSLNVVELRRVQLARALATKPKLLLLDELLTGLTSKECDEAIELIRLINKQGVTVLIVEHVMKVIMGLCDHVTVLHHGEKIFEGTPKEVVNDEHVVKVYLGKRFSLCED
jgi:branched-chain amino acid transport system ATP-binding protein